MQIKLYAKEIFMVVKNWRFFAVFVGISGFSVTDQSVQMLMSNLERHARELLDSAKAQRVGHFSPFLSYE